jgi:hypothetical protein
LLRDFSKDCFWSGAVQASPVNKFTLIDDERSLPLERMIMALILPDVVVTVYRMVFH